MNGFENKVNEPLERCSPDHSCPYTSLTPKLKCPCSSSSSSLFLSLFDLYSAISTSNSTCLFDLICTISLFPFYSPSFFLSLFDLYSAMSTSNSTFPLSLLSPSFLQNYINQRENFIPLCKMSRHKKDVSKNPLKLNGR